MTITELLFPVFKQDAQTQSVLKNQGPEIFSHFIGIPGIQSLFRGSIIVDNGKPVDPSSGRGILVLEWDNPASMHAFYPDSPTFHSFIKLARPLVAAPNIPELFEASISSVSCAESGVTQIFKVASRPNTEGVWSRLKKALLKTWGVEDARPVFSHATGIEDQQGVFLGMVGWRSLQDYEQARMNQDALGLLRELGADGEVFDVVVKVERMPV